MVQEAKKVEEHVHFDQEQVDFKFLQNFINCYKDKMMLNLKDDEEGELLEMLNKNKNQEVDISIDFQHFQKIKDFHKGRGDQKIVSPTDKKVKKCQNCPPGHEFKERVQEYLDMKRKFKKISYTN